MVEKSGVSLLSKFFPTLRRSMNAQSGYNFCVRRRTPVLLFVVTIFLAAWALGDIPTRAPHWQPVLSHSESRFHSGALDEFSAPLDPHPFATEFYLHQFALESGKAASHQRSWFDPVLSPVTNAASSLSKRVASLRHALVKLMP